MFFGGVEGGATHSKLIICNAHGDQVATVLGPSTNHWMLGIVECADRIARMVADGKRAAGIAAQAPLRALGLSLSGCEQESTNSSLEAQLRKRHPLCSDAYLVCSDTVGTLCTALPAGGVCLIAGTGSNSMLRNPDGRTYTCGGWGNMLADEGSAWWIAQRAIKTTFDHMDGLVHSEHAVEVVWQCVRQHFAVQTRADVMEYCYGKFQKCQFAKLCVLLARAADAGDALCRHLFAEAGRHLARAAVTLIARADERLVQDGCVNVVCAGSVWISWHLLRSGFERELQERRELRCGVRMLRLTQLMALGAVYLAADAIEFDLPRDYAKNFEVFDEFGRPKAAVGNGGGGLEQAENGESHWLC